MTRPRPNQLYVAAINVQSLKPHLLELRQDIDQHGYDVISLKGLTQLSISFELR